MSLVTINGLHKRYGANHVLKGIDLNVGAGQVLSLIHI